VLSLEATATIGLLVIGGALESDGTIAALNGQTSLATPGFSVQGGAQLTVPAGILRIVDITHR